MALLNAYLLLAAVLLPTGTALQRIIEGPTDTSVRIGGNTSLTCRVADIEGYVMWSKDRFGLGIDQALACCPRYSINGTDGTDGYHNLLIWNAQLSDEDEYTCQLTPTHPSNAQHPLARAPPAFLTVTLPPRPPRIIDFNGALYATIGELITASCFVEGGKPAPTVSWLIAADINGTSIMRVFSNSTAPGGTNALIEEVAEPLFYTSGANKGRVSGVVNLHSTIRFRAQLPDFGCYLVCKVSHPALDPVLLHTSTKISVGFTLINVFVIAFISLYSVGMLVAMILLNLHRSPATYILRQTIAESSV